MGLDVHKDTTVVALAEGGTTPDYRHPIVEAAINPLDDLLGQPAG